VEHSALRPVPPEGRVSITGGLLARRIDVNRRVSIPHGLGRLEAGGNLHNLAVAAGTAEGYRPTLTLDADVYKWAEAVGWELGRQDDPELRTSLEAVVDLVVAAQADDGYVNSWFQAVEPDRQLADLTRGCEMYCAGHLIEAGVAVARGAGDRRLLDAAVRFADLLGREFGPSGRAGIDGHEEVELALVGLYHETGEARYLELARRLVDLRGHGLVGAGVFGPRYYQDQEPVRSARTVTGHAVRAMYLAAAATDVAVETGDEDLLDALRAQWSSMVAGKMYVTAGLGSRERDEAIGEPYELPPDRAYCETCAAAGLIFWSWRMLRATGEAQYADVLERALYNVLLAGVALDGRSFFYANPLEVRAENEPPFESEWSGETAWYVSPAPEQATANRRPWFRCACCPPNVMRVLSSLEHYVATTSDDGLQLHLYATGEVDVSVGGAPVGLRVETDYPWTGSVQVRVTATGDEPWELSLRVPAWADGATVAIDEGEPAAAPVGYWSARRVWRVGDVVDLALPVRARFVAPSPRVSATRGCVAIERGPLVYCVEHVDNPAVNLADLRIDTATGLQEETVRGEPLDGFVAVRASARIVTPRLPGTWPYRDYEPSGELAGGGVHGVVAVPYFAWSNRGAGAMRVWIPLLARA
jgi:DUF1680 family protein